MPGNWPDAIGLIAGTFHFAPSELWSFDVEELEFWAGRALWLRDRQDG